MELQGIYVNITETDEHVPKVDSYIKTIKERNRSIVNTRPFKILHH